MPISILHGGPAPINIGSRHPARWTRRGEPCGQPDEEFRNPVSGRLARDIDRSLAAPLWSLPRISADFLVGPSGRADAPNERIAVARGRLRNPDWRLGSLPNPPA